MSKSKSVRKVAAFVKSQSKLLIIIILVSLAGWLFYNYREVKKEVVRLSTPEGQQAFLDQQTEDTIERIRKHMVLPEDEVPTVVTITDIDLLTEQQPFFNGAQNGDKVLVYAGARKAIIYSPERDIVVNVGTIVADNEDVVVDEPENEFSMLDIEIRNGTDAPGLAQTISSQLTTTNENFNIVNVSDSENKEISQTVIIDMGKTNNKDLVASVGNILGATTTSLIPEGEEDSDAEVLIILGENQIE